MFTAEPRLLFPCCWDSDVAALPGCSNRALADCFGFMKEVDSK